MKYKQYTKNLRPYVKPDFFFINIGANDGISTDPIYPFIEKHDWAGIAVEPVKKAFDTLKKNLSAHKNIIFENVAISKEAKTFYTVSDELLEQEKAMHQLSSFSKAHLEEFMELLDKGEIEHELLSGKPLPTLEELKAHIVVDDSVNCISFDDLMERNKVSNFDFLNIDVEGSDLDVLQAIDLNKYTPKVICIETICFDDAEQKILNDLLEAHHYSHLQRFALSSDIFVKDI